jgi:hypothetical protein
LKTAQMPAPGAESHEFQLTNRLMSTFATGSELH